MSRPPDPGPYLGDLKSGRDPHVESFPEGWFLAPATVAWCPDCGRPAGGPDSDLTGLLRAVREHEL